MERAQRAELPPMVPKSHRSLKAIVSTPYSDIEQSKQTHGQANGTGSNPSLLNTAKKHQKYKQQREHMSYFDKLKAMIGPGGRYTVDPIDIPQNGTRLLKRVSTQEDENKYEREGRSLSKNVPRLSHKVPKGNRQTMVLEESDQRTYRNQSIDHAVPLTPMLNTVPLNKQNKNFKSILINYHLQFQAVGDRNPPRGLETVELRETIGTGANASVKTAENKQNGQRYAIKIYEKYKLKEPKRLNAVLREIKMLHGLSHDNIIGYIGSYQDKRQIHLILQYFQGITLLQHFRNSYFNLPEENVKTIARQLLSAVEYMHNNGVAHRDLKLDNILVNPETMKIKIIDFGFATGSLMPTENQCGTPNYMAPELHGKKIKYEPQKVDVWAIGVCLYYLVEGVHPFRGYDERDLARKVKSGQFTVSRGDAVFQQFIRELLEVQPDRRPTCGMMLQSRWLDQTSRHS